MSSALLNPTADQRLTPAMTTVLWVIADELDERRIPANTKDAVWLRIPSAKLRGEHARDDNGWLRLCLDRLTGLKLRGEYRGDQWGAVVIAEWHIEQGGSLVRLLIPPAAIHAIRAPETFAKIESFAAYKLEGPARRLYAALADKKRLSKPYWTYGLDELRQLLAVDGKKSYEKWSNLRQWVLDPAIRDINDFGTVTVKMTPQKLGRAVDSVRFDWEWKSVDEARVTEEENGKPDIARRKAADEERAAPPLSDAAKKAEWQPPSEESKARISALVRDAMKAL